VQQTTNGWARARQLHLQLKMDALLTEAAILFNRLGYSATSLDDIAKRLKVTKTAVYHYVKNKNDLLYQCYLRSMQATESCYDEAERRGGTGLEKILAYLELDAAAGVIAMTPLSELDVIENHAARAQLARRLKQCEGRFRSFITAGIADGSIAECDAELATQFILGASRWTMRWYSPEESKPLTEINASFMALITKGLEPRVARSRGARPSVKSRSGA